MKKSRITLFTGLFALMSCFADTAFAAAYSITSGDVLSVTVYRQDDLTRRVRVDASGYIRVPVAGRVQAAGRSADEIERIIAAALSDKGFAQPEVVVSVEEFVPRNVFVLGAVKGTTTMQIPEGSEMTAMQAISAAGGFAENANIYRVVVRRVNDNGEVKLLDVPARRILNGEIVKDVVLEPSDTVIVPHVRAISVLGTVKKPGHFYATPESPLTVSRVIALAGGVERPNSLSKIRVTRGANSYAVDIRDFLESGGKNTDMVLQPGDTVYVPETRW